MTDFFISYTGTDSDWAEWIAFRLEEKGYTTVIQLWDFRPGSNFVIEMHNAAAAERTIMVLSPDYLKSVFAAPEWAAAFAQDPEGMKRKLVPVMVKACQPPGLLAPIVHISLVGLEEEAARAKLLAGVSATRAKPSSPPAFPGAAAVNPEKPFPGPTGGQKPANARTPAYIPTVRRPPTDIDKRRFIKQSFATIRALFEGGLQALPQDQGLEHDFNTANETDFRAEIFLAGNSRCFCRIWLGGMHSENNICFAEGRHMSGDGCNEIIALSDHREELSLTAQMAMGYTSFERTLDMKRLTPDQAAEYLWRRFVQPLER